MNESSSNSKGGPRIKNREVVYQNQYQQIYRATADLSGCRKTYFVNDYGRRVGIVITQGTEMLLVRQPRFLVDELTWEIPGGKVDPGETPEAAAIREAIEETGLYCQALDRLLYFHPGLDALDNPTFVFSTKKFEGIPSPKLKIGEVAECVWLTLDKCIKMIFRGEIVDSLTIAALLAYRTRLTNPELCTR